MRRIALLGLLFGGCVADGGLDRGSSGIVNGREETGYEAVGMVQVGLGQCTGTLVAPRVVVSAKHCLSTSMLPSEITFRTGPWAADLAGTGVKLFHPGERRGHVLQPQDLFAVVLDRDPALTPIPVRRTEMTDDLEDRIVTLVGYGVTANGGRDSETRRAGETTISGVSSAMFQTRRGPGQASNCDGDSGGPVVLDGEVAGVIVGSFLFNCGPYGRHTRVDRYSATIDAAIRWAEENPVEGGLATAETPADSSDSADEPADDDPPTPDVVPNRYEQCPDGYCVGGDGYCDEDLDCCASDPDCAPEPAPDVACDCDTTWGCDDCWCEPVSECEDEGVDDTCDCDVTWQCDGCWCEPADECA